MTWQSLPGIVGKVAEVVGVFSDCVEDNTVAGEGVVPAAVITMSIIGQDRFLCLAIAVHGIIWIIILAVTAAVPGLNLFLYLWVIIWKLIYSCSY
jgi:hypothetical protein